MRKTTRWLSRSSFHGFSGQVADAPAIETEISLHGTIAVVLVLRLWRKVRERVRA